MASATDKLRPKFKRSVARFIAFSGLARACRDHRRFWSGEDAVLCFVVPDAGDLSFYEDAAYLALDGESKAGKFGLRRDEAGVVTYNEGRKGKSAFKSEEPLSAMRRLVAIATDEAHFPDNLKLAADSILHIEGVQPRHVQAAAKICHGMSMTDAEAELVARAPLKLIDAAIRPGRGVHRSIQRLCHFLAASERADRPGPTLDDLHGLGEAGDWGKELAIDLADWLAGRIPWSAVDKGVLLSGPPGTGKTTYASALARTCDVPIVLASHAKWQATGHLGDTLKAMRSTFDEAKTLSPCILFIDEVDSIGDREKFRGDWANYAREIVNCFLELLDGAEGREGVVVVAACNNPGALDDAAKRPGRLDHQITIPLPDRAARQGILRWHTNKGLPEVALEIIAERTEGWSGAELEKLVRTGQRRARRAGRALIAEDLLVALPQKIRLPDGLLRRCAVHEIGHAIAALELGHFELVEVTMSHDVEVGSSSHIPAGGAAFKVPWISERTREFYLAKIMILMSGLAAEEVILGSRSAAGGGASGSDLQRATMAAAMMETSLGVGGQFTYLSPEHEDEERIQQLLLSHPAVAERVELVLREQYEVALRLIKRYRREAETLARFLAERGRLSADEVRVGLALAKTKLSCGDRGNSRRQRNR